MPDALALMPTADADLAPVARDPLALAVAAWLDSKHGRSGSARTRDSYAATLVGPIQTLLSPAAMENMPLCAAPYSHPR
jgi:hypothetical protein